MPAAWAVEANHSCRYPFVLAVCVIPQGLLWCAYACCASPAPVLQPSPPVLFKEPENNSEDILVRVCAHTGKPFIILEKKIIGI